MAADQQATITGEAIDATVTSFPWNEKFDDVAEFELPFGWATNVDNWYVFDSNYAGGEAPELMFWWEPVNEGRMEVRTPPLRTTGMDSLQVSFRHMLDNFEEPGIYDLKLVTRSGDEEFIVREWNDPGDIDAEEISAVINSEEHGVGADRLYLGWFVEGSSDQLVRWAIDDVSVEALPALQVTPDTYDFGEQQVHTASDTVAFTLSNIGGGEIVLSPEDLEITGEDASQLKLHTLDETVTLQDETTAEAKITFIPSKEGSFEARLSISGTTVLLFGESFDPTITELPWEEDFSGLVQGGIPRGWESDTRNWEAFNLNNAGGEPPEMVFWWEPEKEGRFYLETPHIETGGYDELTLSYKYRVRNFGDPGDYTLSVITIADGREHVIEEWVDPPFIEPTVFEGTITTEEHGLGSEEFRLAWVFDGTTNNMTSWDIDDIKLSDDPIDTDAETEADIPETFDLEQNYPNPFNPATTIRYQLPESAYVTLEVYDVTGRRVTTLVDDNRDAGYHEVTFDGTQLASGVYLYRMQAGDFVKSRKLMLVK